MDPNTINLIISLISGIIGGNVTGAAMGEKSIGALGNTLSGLVGGGIGGWILKALGIIAAATTAAHTGVPDAAAPAFDLSSLLANIGGSGVSGALLAWIVSAIKNSMQK